MPSGKTDAWYQEQAKKQYGTIENEGIIEVDDGATVSRTDETDAGSSDGAYVQAWVWVEDEEAALTLCPKCSLPMSLCDAPACSSPHWVCDGPNNNTDKVGCGEGFPVGAAV